ncbi:MAG: hypothetical protein NC211_08950 [Alistipes senegalensis]|nr:hypothetical protein [Alistipes senegalensis]
MSAYFYGRVQRRPKGQKRINYAAFSALIADKMIYLDDNGFYEKWFFACYMPA